MGVKRGAEQTIREKCTGDFREITLFKDVWNLRSGFMYLYHGCIA